MRLGWTVGLAVLLLAQPAGAQTACEGGTCVAKEDLQAFVQLAREAKCRADTPPAFKIDPVTIVVDRDGRIYGSGSDPKPMTFHLDWCNYKIEGKGQVNIVAAQRVEPTSGFRFRTKATIGYLPLTALDKKDGYAGLDAGVLLEPFFLSWANVNAYVGFRSVGAGLGIDLTRNMGLYVGYLATQPTRGDQLRALVTGATR